MGGKKTLTGEKVKLIIVVNLSPNLPQLFAERPRIVPSSVLNRNVPKLLALCATPPFCGPEMVVSTAVLPAVDAIFLVKNEMPVCVNYDPLPNP